MAQTTIASTPMVALPEVFVGAFFALLTAYLIFAYSGTGVLQFPDRAIGTGILQGVDPSRRTRIYLMMVVLPLSVWLGCYQGARALRQRIPGWFSGVRSRVENELCAMFGVVGSVALLARVVADRLDGLTSVLLSLAGLGGVTGMALARRLSTRSRHGRLIRQLTAWSATAPMVLLIWPSLQIGALARSLRATAGTSPTMLWALLLPAIYAVALFCGLRWPGRRRPALIRQAFAAGSGPLLLLPTLCPIANEIQFTLVRRHPVTPGGIALTLLALLLAVAVLMFWLTLHGRLRVQPGRLVTRFGFPAVVFGVTLVSAHVHLIGATPFDPLHDGEHITPVYQLLQFGKWPFVDVWPAHGLFDYWGTLYAQTNGFRPFELTAWNSVLAAFSAMAAYAVLASVSPPVFAFAVVMLLPIQGIFPSLVYSYFSADPALLGVGLLLCYTANRPTVPRYVMLACAGALCFFWTPASGFACIPSTLALLILDCLTADDRRAARRGLGVFVATGVVIFIGYLLVLLARERPVFETLRMVLAFVRADPLLGGRATIIGEFDTMAVFQYVLIPGIGVLYLGKLARHAIGQRPLGRAERILGFLTLASFVLFSRTLARHSILEYYQGFFFPFLALAALMPSAVARSSSAHPLLGQLTSETGFAAHLARGAIARAWFCLGLALYIVAFPNVSRARDPLAAFDFHEWRKDEARYAGSSTAYPKLKAFLDATLRQGDTFLELLNSPLLYTFFERELPGQFFLVSMFNASDDVQTASLRRFDEFGGSDRVPIVLLDCAECTAHVDGIANTLRGYRIAERIYREYVPFGRIDGFEVWVSRKRWNDAGRGVSPLPLGFAEADAYRPYSLEPVRSGADVLRLTVRGADPQVDGAVKVGGITLGGLASYHGVRFQYRTNVPGTVEFFLRYGDSEYDAANSGHVTVQPSTTSDWQTGQLSIPNQVEENLSLTGFRIDPPDGAEFEIKSLELVFGEPHLRGPEYYSLGMLPFVWGNFDARLGRGESTVLERIALPTRTDKPRAIDLVLRNPDKSSGNYLQLCMKLRRTALRGVAPLRRWQSVKHGDSWQNAGNVKLSYGTNPTSTFDFDLVRPNPTAPGLSAALVDSFRQECKRYVIRLSSQYNWSSQPISVIHLESSVPVVLESAELLAGD